MIQRRELLRATAGIAVLSASARVLAQTDATRIIVGFAPGTATDALSRMLSEKLRGGYATTLVVENRIGASGQIAVMALKGARPDGSVMLICPMSILSVNPHTFNKVAYDPFKDLQPVGNCVTADFALAVGPAVPHEITSVQQFMAWCKANPDKASFATGATGSKLHFAGIKLGMEAGVKMTHVGYANGSNAVTDLIGGSVPAYVGVVPTVTPFANRLRVLATMGSARSKFLPQAPTLKESGYNVVINENFGLYLPANASAEQVEKLRVAMTAALKSPEAQTLFATLGMEAAPSDPAELQARLRREFDEWGSFVKQIGFKQDT
ncbi:tripartite tricarboxylate transporter substrate-binding protein [Variovorax sp. J31P207]|uniref:tripartite tricarboxylate transporter substrate-binding protein n=1 Tax=Variovorax sp. J31P207 TaxID=3053510 RepID=UPI0025775442|nr:tripartite tricarboxylate transporter substrate-binding protein [Variovorax sp. J31P207]MDM0072125.1 tripartite tricarboxylate transporter substrate-binding protein [Variovorax sp. J31P207]